MHRFLPLLHMYVHFAIFLLPLVSTKYRELVLASKRLVEITLAVGCRGDRSEPAVSLMVCACIWNRLSAPTPADTAHQVTGDSCLHAANFTDFHSNSERAFMNRLPESQ
jgi:hypothetical protein